MFLPFTFAFLGLAAAAAAQDVTLRGKVEDPSGTGANFVIDCSNTSLTSSNVNLSAFVGQQVRLTGAWNGSMVTPSVDVTALVVVPATFEIAGNAKLGGLLKFEATSTPGDLAAMYVAIDPGFFPAGQVGTLMLSLSPIFQVGLGLIPAGGMLEVVVNVPNDSMLDGLKVHGQSLIVFAAGSSTWSNPDCRTLAP